MALTDSVPSDSPAIMAADSLPAVHGLDFGIMLERPGSPAPAPVSAPPDGMSWLLVALFLVFIVACFRYRKNTRFFSLMLQDVTEVRERHNAFDDTFRETTFVWLLNLLWCGAAGILFYLLLYRPMPGFYPGTVDMRRIGVCIGLAGVYTLFLTGAYNVVGNLFSDSAKASLWVKGYLSSQGLECVVLFPVALLAVCVPTISGAMVLAGMVIFILAKLLFIYKGFCIFFSQIASWVLFLYYLCSLEIVPIVLTYVSARYLCGLV